MKINQNELYFGDAPSLTAQEKRRMVSRDNPYSPFHHVVGNADAISQIEVILFQAIGRDNHCASDLNVAWIGPAGVGKTMFPRKTAEALQLPFVEIDATCVGKPEDIFGLMQKVLAKTTVGQETLAMVPQEDGSYYAPPCVVFIDEVHALDGDLVQALLRATERSTHTLEGKTFRMNTESIMWHFATTDRGRLFDAFDTRFMKIELQPYTREEIASIVRIQFPEIPTKACRLIAKYYHLVTREALQAAALVRMDHDMHEGRWDESVDRVRKRDGIDKYGMSRKRLEVLRALGTGKKSLASLASLVGCKVEELDKFVLPPLMMSRPGIEPLVEVGPGGRFITRAGLEELDRRGIPHQGMFALARSAQYARVS